MDRTVLLVLLAIPVLVVLHVVMFRSDVTNDRTIGGFRDNGSALYRAADRWQPREGSQPTRFVVNPTNEQGS